MRCVEVSRVINENFLKTDLDDISFDKIIGNLPYNISSQIIFKILNHNNWSKAIFMIQKELADRIVSKEGSKQYGRISVMIQSICQVKKEFNDIEKATNSFKKAPPAIDPAWLGAPVFFTSAMSL